MQNHKLEETTALANRLTLPQLKDFVVRLVDMLVKKRLQQKEKASRRANSPNTDMVKVNSLSGDLLCYLMKNMHKEETSPRIFDRFTIAKSMGKAESEISRSTIRLIRLGYITKRRIYYPETDKFRNVYGLTPRGAFLAKEILELRKKRAASNPELELKPGTLCTKILTALSEAKVSSPTILGLAKALEKAPAQISYTANKLAKGGFILKRKIYCAETRRFKWLYLITDRGYRVVKKPEESQKSS